MFPFCFEGVLFFNFRNSKQTTGIIPMNDETCEITHFGATGLTYEEKTLIELGPD